MTIVVEIASRTGTRAYKEYDAPSVDAAIKEANRKLQAYPEFWVTGFSVDRGRAVQRIPKEENLTAPIGEVSAREATSTDAILLTLVACRFADRLLITHD
jgi:hypothetical protein